MAYEIDFLPVGNGTKSGDAIAIRWGDLMCNDRSKQFVLVVDGGTNVSGQVLVEHVRNYYGTDQVDLVVNTHPDADHASGLSVVIESLGVKQLMMHRPWNHSAAIHDLFNDGRVTPSGIRRKLEDGLEHAFALETLAEEYGIQIIEPFSGIVQSHCGGLLWVLGPSKEYYQSLLPNFRCTPEVKESKLTANKSLWGLEAGIALAQRILETLGVEMLEEPAENSTSAENNSSAILLLQVDGKQLLLTGDSGVPALRNAVAFAKALTFDMRSNVFTQVPHHGSRRNVGPSILDELIGPKQNFDIPTKSAFVSASKESTKHPSRRVTNAFRRRGAKVLGTQGVSIWHYSGDVPQRAGYGPATPLPFYSEVEDNE